MSFVPTTEAKLANEARADVKRLLREFPTHAQLEESLCRQCSKFKTPKRCKGCWNISAAKRLREQGAPGQPIKDIREAVLAALKKRGCKPAHLEALRAYCIDHTPQDQIALAKGITQGAVHQWFKGMSDQIGYAFESVYSDMLDAKGIIHNTGGGNKSTCDQIIFNADNTVARIESVKCFLTNRPYVSVSRSELAQSEVNSSHDWNCPLVLVFFDIWSDYLHPPQLDRGQQVFTFRRPKEKSK
jgi:hypothetical protein